jgi:hypothetical protein
VALFAPSGALGVQLGGSRNTPLAKFLKGGGGSGRRFDEAIFFSKKTVLIQCSNP